MSTFYDMKEIVVCALILSILGCNSRHHMYGIPESLGFQKLSGVLEVREHLRKNIVGPGGHLSKISGGERGASVHYEFYGADYKPVKPKQVRFNEVMVKENYGACNAKLGAMNHWQVWPDDAGEVPSIIDSVLAPKEFYITYPNSSTTLDSVSRSKGFICVYESPGTDLVRISLAYEIWVSGQMTDSERSLHRIRIDTTVSSTGSYFVTPAMLSVFPKSGNLQMWVTAFGNKIIEIDGRRYQLSAEIASGSYCYLKE